MHERACMGFLIGIIIATGLWIGASTLAPKPQRSVDALIGYGCGPAKQTMVAREEDEFPQCDRIIPNPDYQEN